MKKESYEVTIIADDDTPGYTVRTNFHCGNQSNLDELVLSFNQAIKILEEEKNLQIKQATDTKIISLLTDCVSSTWGAKTFTKAQKLYDKFLERHNLSTSDNKGFNERNISRIQESEEVERKYSKEELKDYAWFHRSYIADLPNFRNPDNQPIFEQWLDLKNSRETSVEARGVLDSLLTDGEIKLVSYLKIMKVIDK